MERGTTEPRALWCQILPTPRLLQTLQTRLPRGRQARPNWSPGETEEGCVNPAPPAPEGRPHRQLLDQHQGGAMRFFRWQIEAERRVVIGRREAGRLGEHPGEDGGDEGRAREVWKSTLPR